MEDRILSRMERGVRLGRRSSSKQFFRLLLTFTLEGFLCDPIYGGNRDRVGWKLARWDPCWWAPKKVAVLVRRRGTLPY